MKGGGRGGEKVRMEEVRGGGMEVKSGGREGGERIRMVNEKMRY